MRLLLAISALTLSALPVVSQPVPPTLEEAIATQAFKCLDTVPAAVMVGTVRLQVELNQDGYLVGSPKVLERPEGNAGRDFAKGSRLALGGCAPYDADKPGTYEVVITPAK